VARALAAPGTASRLELPHTFRVAGVAFLITMALGHLPALFALLLALHIISVSALLRRPPAPLPATAPLTAAAK
jgi:hypothetical protein